MKRSNGEGCVRKLKGNRRKPFQAIATKYDKETKKQYFKSIGTYTTRSEAEYNLYKYIHETNTKDINNYKTITLENIYKKWIVYKEKECSYNTLRSYRTAYNNIKKIRSKDIKKIDIDYLQNFIDNYTIAQQKQIRNLLTQLFDYAVARDYINKNYVKYLKLKRDKRDKKDIKCIFTSNEIQDIFCKSQQATNNKDIYIILKILLYTGMRISELLQLRKNNIDLNNNIIHISKSKTQSGKRDIIIHTEIVQDIEKLYLQSNDKIIKSSYQNVRRKLEKAYPNHTPHDTRHTFITQCTKCKMDNYILKLLVGHSTNDITKDVYTHLDINTIASDFKKFKY